MNRLPSYLVLLVSESYQLAILNMYSIADVEKAYKIIKDEVTSATDTDDSTISETCASTIFGVLVYSIFLVITSRHIIILVGYGNICA